MKIETKTDLAKSQWAKSSTLKIVCLSLSQSGRRSLEAKRTMKCRANEVVCKIDMRSKFFRSTAVAYRFSRWWMA